jgi:hypothetical protein
MRQAVLPLAARPHWHPHVAALVVASGVALVASGDVHTPMGPRMPGRRGQPMVVAAVHTLPEDSVGV